MKDAFYFPHDSNAKDDPKCSILLEQLGCEGYGIFWILIETLREQPNYRYPMGLLPVIARKYNTTHEKVRVVVGNYGLFSIDADEFFSLSLNRRMEQVEQIRNINRMKGIKSGEARRLLALTTTKQTVVEPKLNSGSTVVEQKKGKETKLKKLKKVNSKEPIQDFFIDFWSKYPKKKAKGDAEKAWKKIKPTEYDALFAGLEAQKKSNDWLKDGGKFIPYPASWLNGRRWEDSEVIEIEDKTDPNSEYQKKLRRELEESRRFRNEIPGI